MFSAFVSKCETAQHLKQGIAQSSSYQTVRKQEKGKYHLSNSHQTNFSLGFNTSFLT